MKNDREGHTMRTLHSSQDHSVNFVELADGPGFYESRYVRRDDDYFIIYLSCQSGCDQACRMCHLTATGQTALVNASVDQLFAQAQQVYGHYEQKSQARLVHYNFMARGEALNSPAILNEHGKLFSGLHQMAADRGLESKILISSIFPKTLGDRKLEQIFSDVHPEIYYSLYSMSPAFRKRWLGKALGAEQGLDLLKNWQIATGKTPKIHFAFIEGENDSEADMRAMADAINARDLKINLNVVRYNPHSDKYGRESDEAVIERNVRMLTEWVKPDSVRIVPKVGFDVKASCGMFVDRQF